LKQQPWGSQAAEAAASFA